jgi:HK97 family phage prohead protease
VIEIRDRGQDAWAASGWATTWSSSPDRGAYFVAGREGTFLERVQRGAFDDAASGRDSVELRREHDEHGPVFASTRAGSLALEDHTDGLMLAAALSKRDAATVRAVEDVRAGRLTGLSVGMIVRRDDWGTASDSRTALRTIHAATLNEVSMVGRPANPQATILDVHREQRGEAVEYRSLPLAFRDDRVGFTYVTCPSCGENVPVTDDNLKADDDDDDGRSEGRRDFTEAQLVSIGKAGKALWIDGHWAYPTPMRSDFDDAVISIGRTPGRNRQTVRKYLMRRAKAEGWPIPSTWNTDGSTKSAGRSLATNDTAELEHELWRKLLS